MNLYDQFLQFGRHDNENNLHGKGIRITNDGLVWIAFFKGDRWSVGNYFRILSSGLFKVGEYYKKNDNMHDKYTAYRTDGSEAKFDEELW